MNYYIQQCYDYSEFRVSVWEYIWSPAIITQKFGTNKEKSSKTRVLNAKLSLFMGESTGEEEAYKDEIDRTCKQEG